MSRDPVAKKAFRAGVEAIGRTSLQEALRHFGRACGRDPDVPRYEIYRAWVTYQLIASASQVGSELRLSSCRAVLINAISKDPHFDAGYVLLGTILLSEGRIERAQQCFERALALNPENVGARMGLDSIQAPTTD